MPQIEGIREPAQVAASWPEPWCSMPPASQVPPVFPAWYYPPPAWYTPTPLEEPPTPGGTVSKLTYSVDEAAQVLGVSRSTLYNLIHREDFPALKLGNRQLISREGLAEWVRKQVGCQGVSV